MRIRRRLALLLVALTVGTVALSCGHAADPQPPVRKAGAPTAAELLHAVPHCGKKLTKSPLRTDADVAARIDVCAAKGGAFFTADMDVDCDGRRTSQCNVDTDCCYQDDTAFHQSDGEPLNSAELPYFVLPAASGNWEWRKQGIGGGSIAAIIYRGKVRYAVFGDTDVPGRAGEASYATARSLGIDPDPRTGGADSGVTYIVFSGATADPIESHGSAVRRGQRAAREFLEHN